MLVTAIASVATVIVVDMAGCTFRIVMLVETEILFMIKGSREPAILSMTLPTIALELLVQGVARGAVASIALFPNVRL